MSRRLMAMVCALGMLAGAAEDAFQGDWKGTLRRADGQEETVFAQVLAQGKGTYRAVLRRVIHAVGDRESLATLEGKAEGGAVTFAGGAGIREGVFSGATPAGQVSLKPYRHVSPTLGERPPAGAKVILGPETELSGFQGSRRTGGIVNLNRSLQNASNCVGYLFCRIDSDAERDVVLKTGSDDGIVVFLNGQRLYTKDVPRALKADEDSVPLHLRQGENELLLKVIQGGGDWQGVARVCDASGRAVSGVRFRPEGSAGKALAPNGTVLCWLASGPYRRGEGQQGSLAELAFAPERGVEAASWQLVDCGPDRSGYRWNLLPGGVAEIARGGGSMVSVEQMGSFRMHLEFRNAMMPEARGQGRSNSGVYLHGRYEIQVLDSFGLEPRNNDCAGIYQQAVPLANACLAPGEWQTYDIDFTAAQFDQAGNKTRDAELTLRFNGVLVHDRLAIRCTPGGFGQKDVPKGPLMLQDHGNPVQFRNIWFVEK